LYLNKETGNWAIEAVARHVIDEENSWGDIDVIHLNVGVDYAVLGWPSVGPVSEIEQVAEGMSKESLHQKNSSQKKCFLILQRYH